MRRPWPPSPPVAPETVEGGRAPSCVDSVMKTPTTRTADLGERGRKADRIEHRMLQKSWAQSLQGPGLRVPEPRVSCWRCSPLIHFRASLWWPTLLATATMIAWFAATSPALGVGAYWAWRPRGSCCSPSCGRWAVPGQSPNKEANRIFMVALPAGVWSSQGCSQLPAPTALSGRACCSGRTLDGTMDADLRDRPTPDLGRTIVGLWQPGRVWVSASAVRSRTLRSGPTPARPRPPGARKENLGRHADSLCRLDRFSPPPRPLLLLFQSKYCKRCVERFANRGRFGAAGCFLNRTASRRSSRSKKWLRVFKPSPPVSKRPCTRPAPISPAGYTAAMALR